MPVEQPDKSAECEQEPSQPEQSKPLIAGNSDNQQTQPGSERRCS